MSGAESTLPNEQPRPRGRRRLMRWPTRILAIVGFTAIALVLVQMFLLGHVVRYIVHRALIDMGFQNVSFEVQRVTFFHTDIADLRLDGEGINRIGDLSADYTIRTLLDGRIKTLRVERAEVKVGIARDGSIDLGPLDLSAGRGSKKEAQPDSDGRLPFDRLELVDSILNVAWEERNFALPVRGDVWDLGGQKSSIELVAFLHDKPLRIDGTFEGLGKQIEISAEASSWSIADVLASVPARYRDELPRLAGILDVSASYRRDSGGGLASGRLRASLTPPATPPAGTSIGGLLRAEASVRILPDRVEPLITVSARNVSISDPQLEYAVRGLSGAVTINGFGPLRSPDGQKLTIAEADIGQLKLSESVLTFGIESAARYSIQLLETGFAGGRLAVTPFRVDFTRPVVETVLTAKNLDLEQLLASFAEKKVTGRGRVSGQVPLRLTWQAETRHGLEVINWSEPRLVLGEGILRAEPGGILSLANPEAMLGDYLENDPAYRKGGSMAGVKTDLMASLRGLTFSTLQLRFVERSGELVPSVRIVGRGQGPRGRQIDITINLKGFEGVLKRSMSIRKIFG